MPDVEKPKTTLPGTVEKIIESWPGESERAQISLEGADHLYKEIRIENNMINAEGEAVSLKPGAEVEVTIEADPKDTIKKSEHRLLPKLA